MQRSLSQVLLEILEVMQYTNNKEKFVAEFEEVTNLETVINLVEPLSFEEQKYIERIKDQPEKVMAYFSFKVYYQEREKVIASALHDFFEVIAPVLTTEQKERINKIIAPSV